MSAAYPLPLCLSWGRAIAKASFRLCSVSAEKWAKAELDRVSEDPARGKLISLQVREKRCDEVFLFGSQVLGKQSALAVNVNFCTPQIP